MGDCVSVQDRNNHEAKYRVGQDARAYRVNQGREKNFFDQNRLSVPSNGNGKNLFKTFSDWDQTEDPQQIQKGETKKAKRRRYSEDLKVVTKMGEYRLTMKKQKELKASDNTKASSPKVKAGRKPTQLAC